MLKVWELDGLKLLSERYVFMSICEGDLMVL